MRTRRTAAGAIAAATLTLAMAGTASADIYWAAEGGDAIGRASNAGGDVQTGFIGGAGVATDPTGVAVNGTHIFWSHDEGTGGSIGRADLSGSSPDGDFILTSGDAGGVGLDNSRVYWTHVDTGAGWVGRATTGGFVLDQTFQPTANVTPCGVTANGDRTWWANEGTPGSLDSAHGIDEPEPNIVPGATSDPCGVALANGLLYWTNQGAATIGRAVTNGSNASASFVATGVGSTPCGVAVAGNHIYWTDPVSDNIGRVELDGTTNLNAAFIDLASGTDPCGIAVTPTQQATPAARDFGETTIGGQSAVESFAIANTASSILDVTSATLVGADPGQFEITGDGCTPNATSAGLSCFVNAVHNPTAPGDHSATLRISSNATNSPTDVPLTGVGTVPPAEAAPEPPGDTAPPDTAITEGPPGKTKSKSATFAFSGNDAREVTGFQCKLDSGSFETCTSPKAYSGLKKGTHTFSVRAVDAAGNVDATPATRTWTVKKKKKKKRK